MKVMIFFACVVMASATFFPAPNPYGNLRPNIFNMKQKFLGMPPPNIASPNAAVPQTPTFLNKLFGQKPWFGGQSMMGLPLQWPDLFGGLGNLFGNRLNYSNICIYSSDPSKYTPKCFLCPEPAYDSILQACQQAKDAPSNVSYIQADCMEKNCAINYPEGDVNVGNIRVRRQAESVPISTDAPSVGDNDANDNNQTESPLPARHPQSLTYYPPLEYLHRNIERLYRRYNANRAQDWRVLNNTNFAVTHQAVFYAVA